MENCIEPLKNMGPYSKSQNCMQYNKVNMNIQGLTRLDQDSCYKSLQAKTIQQSGKYDTRNFHDCVCESPYVLETSLQQPILLHRDGYGWTSMNGCNIDNDSKLRNAKNLTNTRCINQLFERPYTTVPYMGRGGGDICTETKLLPGEDTFQNRPCNNLAGVYIDRFVPQIPCLRQNIQNTNHIIPEDSDKYWIRGGQPSRQVIRNKDYLKKCGFEYNGKFWK